MTATLTPGANAPLAAVRVTVEVTAPQRLDVSGLLVTAAGRVRSDADLIYYNAPHRFGVSHRPATGAIPGAITIDTWSIPADIARVVVAASLDDPGAVFGGAEPTATVRDADTGQVLTSFTPPQLTLEKALVIVELYRRGTEWKIRAVGQGYADGLAGIATDFGVTVDQPAGAVPPMPAYTPEPAAGPVPSAPPQPAAPPRVTLDKGRVSLVKGGSVSLVKADGPVVSSVRMALGWQPAGRRNRNIDLDASCIVFDAQRERLETAWFMKLNVFNGAIQHTGDNLTGGRGQHDDEAIDVHLDALPPQARALVFVVNSFSGQRFTDVQNAYCRLLDATTGEELVRYDLTSAEPATGVVMCKLVRQHSGEWVMTALGHYVDAQTARGMVQPAAALL